MSFIFVGPTSTHSRCNGRERISFPLIQRVAKCYSLGHTTTSLSRPFPRTNRSSSSRCRRHHKFLPVSNLASVGKLKTHTSEIFIHPSLSFLSHLRTPIELVKCKMQVQMLMAPTPALSAEVLSAEATSAALASTNPSTQFQKLPGPISVLISVVRSEGIRGLWLGQTGTLIRETGGGAAWFVSKEAIARILLARRHRPHHSDPSEPQKKLDLEPWESAVSGAFAGILYNLAMFPADTAKSAMQTEAELRPRAAGQPGPTFVGTLRAMYNAQGLKGLYAGCGITVARAVPSSALIFLIYDGLKTRFS